ncbi:TRAP transporter substrate-binding protein [Psychromonas sp. SR45-3]|uniref:TRAP transporter substrate-binding protein n=1 Tax=Psychromonas sp. SR45-3 TaxID=2760930 RepID=UPI0015FD0A04|nr:TRAP transporter substrate-binding protein [Psychromonas sp. SR45-3]MBB1271891.1 TRAP transporter substrate-binding protein [Psychromonas sp. SR45-3]
MKRLLTLLTIATACATSFTVSSADYTLKLGHLANEDNVWNKAVVKLSEDVYKKSNGRLEINIYPNDQLGNELDVINSIQLGTADMTISGESLQNWAPKAALLAIPYAFKDSEQLAKAANGEVGKAIEKQITQKTGLVPIAWFERGARNLTSNKPIKTPDDLDGMTLRVPNVPLFVSVWDALGAKPIPMSFSEVFTSLQQGTIKGQENPLSLIKSASFYEVQDYVNLTEHVRSWIYVVIGQNQLNRLPQDLQKILLTSAKDMQKYEHELMLEDEKQLVNFLKEKGMTFVESDQALFREKALEAVQKSLNKEQLSLFEQIQKL